MYDVLTIAAIVDELNAELVDGRIQNVLQVDALTIAFEIYAQRQRRWLVASAGADAARILLTPNRVDADSERVTPLLLLLRKYARGGRIVSISQPPYERIVRVSIAKPLHVEDDDGDEAEADLVYTDLYVELMGRRSNILLVSEDGRILDAIKRVSPDMSRVRPIRPGLSYTPPPAQDKADPLVANASRLLQQLQNATEPLPRALVSAYLGISPVIAREIAARARIPTDAPPSSLDETTARRLAEAMTDVFAPLRSARWQPVVYTGPDGSAEFSPIQLRMLEQQDGMTAAPFNSISAAAQAAWEARSTAAPQRHAIRRERLVAEIEDARERVAQRVRSLEEQANRAAEAEHLRMMGEMIYAYVADIQPGQTELQTPDGIVIPLDPDLTPSQMAQEYFERYRKARSAEENVPQMIDKARQELEYLDQLRSMAQLSETYDEIESVRLEWLAFVDATGAGRATKPKGARPAKSARRPRSYKTREGHTVFVGRTGQQNDMVTFDIAGPNDLWLHARNMPGAHVILRANGGASDDAIERAAALAAWYSDGRQSTAVPVDVTERRHVRKIKGAGPGMVTYRNERTLNVRPLSERDLGLERTEH